MAAARLHSIVQERPVEKLQESCFIVGSIERILTMSVGGMAFSFLLSVCCVSSRSDVTEEVACLLLVKVHRSHFVHKHSQ